jgi:hypothetical protein
LSEFHVSLVKDEPCNNTICLELLLSPLVQLKKSMLLDVVPDTMVPGSDDGNGVGATVGPVGVVVGVVVEGGDEVVLVVGEDTGEADGDTKVSPFVSLLALVSCLEDDLAVRPKVTPKTIPTIRMTTKIAVAINFVFLGRSPPAMVSDLYYVTARPGSAVGLELL